LEQIGAVAIVVAFILAAWGSLRPATMQPTASDPAESDALRARRRLFAPTLVAVALLSQASLSADAWGFPKYIALALPLLFAFLGGEIAVLIGRRQQRWLAITLAFLLVLSLGLQTVQSLRRPGGTLYMAGEQGFLEAVQVLMANTMPDDVFLGSKDTSFYAGRDFVQWSGPLLADPVQLEDRVRTEGIRFIAASQGQIATVSQQVATWLAEHSSVIAEPGDHRVYQLR
jgi:hypothetical protein